MNATTKSEEIVREAIVYMSAIILSFVVLPLCALMMSAFGCSGMQKIYSDIPPDPTEQARDVEL